MSLQILPASGPPSDDDGDLYKIMSVNIEDSLSNPLTCCMLQKPYSRTDHVNYAYLHCIAALEDDRFRVFIAQDTESHGLESVLGTVWIADRKIADPLRTLELPDFVNEDLYRYVHRQAEAQRLTKVIRNYYSAKPTHPQHNQMRKTLATFAVAEIRKTKPDSDIVAQETKDSEDSDQVFPAAEGWEKIKGVVVLDSPMLHTLEQKQRTLRMFVNWGQK